MRGGSSKKTEAGQLPPCQVTVGWLPVFTKGHSSRQAPLPILLCPLYGHLLSLTPWVLGDGKDSALFGALSLNVFH